MSVTPIQVEMTSTGGAGRSQVTVTNDSNEPLPVEVEIEKMSLDENGDRQAHESRRRLSRLPTASNDRARLEPGVPPAMGRRADHRDERELPHVGQPGSREDAGRQECRTDRDELRRHHQRGAAAREPEPRRGLDRRRGGQEIRQALSDDHGRESDQHPCASAAVDDRALRRRLVAHHVGDRAHRKSRHRPRPTGHEAHVCAPVELPPEVKSTSRRASTSSRNVEAAWPMRRITPRSAARGRCGGIGGSVMRAAAVLSAAVLACATGPALAKRDDRAPSPGEKQYQKPVSSRLNTTGARDQHARAAQGRRCGAGRAGRRHQPR